MLTIRPEQFEALDANAHHAFHIRLMSWLREHSSPAVQMDDVALLGLIARGEARAAPYGLTSERDIARWCLLATLTNEKFSEEKQVGEFLRNPRYGSPSERLQIVLNSLAWAIDRTSAR